MVKLRWADEAGGIYLPIYVTRTMLTYGVELRARRAHTNGQDHGHFSVGRGHWRVSPPRLLRFSALVLFIDFAI